MKLAAVLSASHRSGRPLISAALLVGLTALAVAACKHVIARVDTAGSSTPGSFPSGHMAISVTTVGGLLLLAMPRTRYWQWVAVSPVWLVMAWCLLYGDVHWLTDVIGGALLGWSLLGVTRARPQAGVSLDQREHSNDRSRR